MFGRLSVLVFTLFTLIFTRAGQAESDNTVLLAILARNKAHVLPYYLKCIDHLDYDKKAITVYINTNNNCDATEALLHEWAAQNENTYAQIIFDAHHVSALSDSLPHEWTYQRFQILGAIRNKSLAMAKQFDCAYYFVVDCDNFIAPYTLKDLIKHDKPIIAPMLRALPFDYDPYSNYFCAITDSGYYAGHPDYYAILSWTKTGTFKVPVVHCTYLIKSDFLDKLTYVDGSYDYEFVIFSRTARKNNVDQYICNEKPFGTLLHCINVPDLTVERESQVVEEMNLSSLFPLNILD